MSDSGLALGSKAGGGREGNRTVRADEGVSAARGACPRSALEPERPLLSQVCMWAGSGDRICRSPRDPPRG